MKQVPKASRAAPPRLAGARTLTAFNCFQRCSRSTVFPAASSWLPRRRCALPIYSAVATAAAASRLRHLRLPSTMRWPSGMT